MTRGLAAFRRRAYAAAKVASAEGAEVLANGVRSRAPLGKTGELAGFVSVTTRGARSTVLVDSDHAAAVELGTSDQPAQPFIRPTAEQDFRAAAAAANRTFKRLIT